MEIKIGTRGSPLALAQAHETERRILAARPDITVSIVVIRTTGDMIRDRALSEAGGKGLFTKEIDEALADGRIDIAVHSMKDVPTKLPDWMALPCILPREDPRDALICLTADSLADLPEGAVVGTASLRRGALVLHRNPGLRTTLLRGNVETRLAKVRGGEIDATILAMAGLNRLGLSEHTTRPIAPEDMLPAVAQGAVGITARADDAGTLDLLAELDDEISHRAVRIERAFLARLDGSCRTPIAALAELSGDRVSFRGLIARPDGSDVRNCTFAGTLATAEEQATEAAGELLAAVGPDYLTG
ncbi:MAG: hydroxymethylbilane synthase [Rhodospirillales bacterium]